jgi:hypothetical protein
MNATRWPSRDHTGFDGIRMSMSLSIVRAPAVGVCAAVVNRPAPASTEPAMTSAGMVRLMATSTGKLQ